jgi:hypothetical protein
MPEKENRTIEYVIGTLAVVLLVLVIFLVLNYRALRRSAIMNAHQSFLAALMTHHHGPATIADLAFIRPWMTFDYLNKFFALPSQYLQTQLSISDPHYPRITIAAYVKSAHLDLTTFLHQLDTALRARLTNATSTLY